MRFPCTEPLATFDAKALGIEELTVYIRLPNGYVVEGLYDL